MIEKDPKTMNGAAFVPTIEDGMGNDVLLHGERINDMLNDGTRSLDLRSNAEPFRAFINTEPEQAQLPSSRWRRIMDVLVPNRRKQVASCAGVASAAEMVLQPDQAATLEKLYANAREHYTSDGRALRLVSYMDRPEYDWLTAKVDAGQRKKYVEERVWKPDAKGTPVRGQNVQIYAFLDPETDEPVGALRKVHASTWNEVCQTPSFRKFWTENAFSEEGLTLFRRLARNRSVVEVAGLWKQGDYPADVRAAMYRFAIQDSMQQNELWFMGVVGTTYRELKGSYGPNIIHTIGSTIGVQDEDAAHKTRITPIIADPSTLLADLLHESDAHKQAGDIETALRAEVMLLSTMRGMDLRVLDSEVSAELKERLGNVGR